MAIRKGKKNEETAVVTAEPQPIELSEGVVLFEQAEHLSFPNLGSAITELVKELRADEKSKLAMARIVDAIERQELYRETGVETMAAFFPQLLERTASVGWKSATSIKRYLGWYRLYLLGLQLPEEMAIRATSHLHTLYRLAHIDRKTGELSQSEKQDKLSPVQFEDITRLVAFLVDAKPMRLRAGLKEGVSAEVVAEVLAANGLNSAAQTYKELMGTDVALPPGGWTVSCTEAIVAKVIGATEDEPKEKLTQVWIGYETFDGSVFIEYIEYRDGTGVVDTIKVGRTYSTDIFAKLSSGDKVEVTKADSDEDE